MSIEIPLIIALIISLGSNVLGFYYMRDILGRLGWLTQNMAALDDMIKGYQKHLKEVHQLEQFYGDEQIKTLLQHTTDLVEVLSDYMEVGLDTELIEDESEFLTEENNEETKKKE